MSMTLKGYAGGTGICVTKEFGNDLQDHPGKCMNDLRKRSWHRHTPMQGDITPAQRALYEPGTPHVLLAIIEGLG